MGGPSNRHDAGLSAYGAVTSIDRGSCDAKIHALLRDCCACDYGDSCGHGESRGAKRQANRVHGANGARGCAGPSRLGYVSTRCVFGRHDSTGCVCTGHVCTGHVFTRHVFTEHVSTGHVFAGHVFTGHVFTGHVFTDHFSARHGATRQRPTCQLFFTRRLATRNVSNGSVERGSFVNGGQCKRRACHCASSWGERREPLLVPERRLDGAWRQPQHGRRSGKFGDQTANCAVVTFARDDGKRRAYLCRRSPSLAEQKGQRERRYAVDVYAKRVAAGESSPPVELSVKTEIFGTKKCCPLSLRKRISN
jgi:hypothetical protein